MRKAVLFHTPNVALAHYAAAQGPHLFFPKGARSGTRVKYFDREYVLEPHADLLGAANELTTVVVNSGSGHWVG